MTTVPRMYFSSLSCVCQSRSNRHDPGKVKTQRLSGLLILNFEFSGFTTGVVSLFDR
jgi:hypothetical protein